MASSKLIRDYGIRPSSVYYYSSEFDALKKFLEKKATEFISGKGHQYVAVQNFTKNDLADLEKRDWRGELPKFKLIFYEQDEVLILKLAATPHETVAGNWTPFFVMEQLASNIRPDAFIHQASKRCRKFNGIPMEPDCSLKPATRTSVFDSPSFVVEVGDLEAHDQLQRDARRWLEEMMGKTKIVLLIYISMNRRTLVFQRWQHSPDPLKKHTRSGHPCYCAQKMQQVTYDHVRNEVTGGPLILPTDRLFDTVPSMHLGRSQSARGDCGFLAAGCFREYNDSAGNGKSDPLGDVNFEAGIAKTMEWKVRLRNDT
ncbi:hypothetical protein VTN77DRAFT_6436 [Rasamsonia byssochlamydoides]|uniref:uncharacterized protein n=1 Tax=Rasamsonia byssochlamydoides TaxID=89139 RepID=UPI0037426CAD